MDTKSFGRGPPSLVDDQFTEDSGVADFNEQVWRVLRERGHLEQIAPMTAGLTIQTTTDLRSLPIAPWAGLGVIAAWAIASLMLGALLLRRRDA